MFYCVRDKRCYVIIINEHTNFIVTLLNIRSQFRWLDRRVTERDTKSAKSLMFPNVNSSIINNTINNPVFNYNAGNMRPFNFYIKYHILDINSKLHTIKFSTVPACDYQYDIPTYLSQIDIIKLVRDELQHQNKPTNNIDAISIKLGNKGLSTIIDYPQSIYL